MKCVIAEDSLPTRLFLRRVLIEAGHEVAGIGTNGQEAVALCKEHRPDLALLDRTMPRLGGDVAAKEILDNAYARNVIMISLDAQLATFNALIARGVQVLGKPIRREQILAAIAALH